jgi:predicted nuclease of restriction endonuclease-like (RecB) superfamily
VGDQEFYIDLLFYHLKLRVYVVIDLKHEIVRAGVRRQDEFLSLGCERPASASR